MGHVSAGTRKYEVCKRFCPKTQKVGEVARKMSLRMKGLIILQIVMLSKFLYIFKLIPSLQPLQKESHLNSQLK